MRAQTKWICPNWLVCWVMSARPCWLAVLVSCYLSRVTGVLLGHWCTDLTLLSRNAPASRPMIFWNSVSSVFSFLMAIFKNTSIIFFFIYQGFGFDVLVSFWNLKISICVWHHFCHKPLKKFTLIFYKVSSCPYLSRMCEHLHNFIIDNFTKFM